MERFLIRKSPSGGTGETGSAKKARVEEEDDDDTGDKEEPRTLLSWNANSLLNRLASKEDTDALSAALKEHDPDVISIQEVRAAAHCAKGVKITDLSAHRDRRMICHNDNERLREKDMFDASLRSGGVFASYLSWLSLANYKYAGTGLFIHRRCRQPKRVYFNFDEHATQHDKDGRIIICEFPSGLIICSLYAPNNGSNKAPKTAWKGPGPPPPLSFARRIEWDAKLKTKLVQWAGGGREVICIGDLNVAHSPPDVTHPQFFAEQSMAAEGSCQDDLGQPGYTLNERRRFGEILDAAEMVDAFRYTHQLNPPDAPPVNEATGDVDTEGPWWTWRGTGAITDRYFKRGMRIDYSLISRSLVPRLERAEILGRGSQREGFLGSDHAPILLKLRPK